MKLFHEGGVVHCAMLKSVEVPAVLSPPRSFASFGDITVEMQVVFDNPSLANQVLSNKIVMSHRWWLLLQRPFMSKRRWRRLRGKHKAAFAAQRNRQSSP